MHQVYCLQIHGKHVVHQCPRTTPVIWLQNDCSASMMHTDGSSIDDMCDKSTWFRVVTNQTLACSGLPRSSREFGESGRKTPPKNSTNDGQKANPRDSRHPHLTASVTLMIRLMTWATRMKKVRTSWYNWLNLPLRCGGAISLHHVDHVSHVCACKYPCTSSQKSKNSSAG